MRILVVDDDPLAAEMTSAILEDAGYPVVVAENAVAAMEKLAAEPEIRLVVSDMTMPLINGIELFRSLREQSVEIPFIILSGDEPDSLRAQEPACDDFLMKDYSLMATLVESVNKILSRGL